MEGVLRRIQTRPNKENHDKTLFDGIKYRRLPTKMEKPRPHSFFPSGELPRTLQIFEQFLPQLPPRHQKRDQDGEGSQSLGREDLHTFHCPERNLFYNIVSIVFNQPRESCLRYIGTFSPFLCHNSTSPEKLGQK